MLTALEDFLIQEIVAHGPMPLDQFHTYALFHPLYGYYKTQTILGRGGDFVTAPEISPLFGDIVTAVFLYEWERLGSPSTWSLIELGPGQGTLMRHILASSQKFKRFHEGLSVALCEIHPLLKEQQKEKISPFKTPIWVETLDHLENLPSPLMIMGNEFLDTFAVKQWQVKNKERIERKVVWSGTHFEIIPLCTSEEIVEESPTQDAYVEKLLALLKNKGGFIWFADYGFINPQHGDSWQGIYKGKVSSPLQNVGLTDLSAHVNFERLKVQAEAQDCSCEGPMTQREFLLKYGISARLDQLKKNATLAQKAALEAGYMRLVHPLQMGDMFKVIMIRP